MENNMIQWHPGFVSAIHLELADSRDELIFEHNYNLNTMPLQVDLLVIKKNHSVHISNEIGHIFRGHNLMEYKSPEDGLNIDVFYKATAYACLYKSYGNSIDERPADDITVSLVREKKPEKLFRYFFQHNIRVSTPFQGIYYLEGEEIIFPTQIIVTKELERKNHTWLKALSQELEKTDMQQLLQRIEELTQKADKEFAESVLEVSVNANRRLIKQWKEDNNMIQALMEIMEPEIKKATEEAQRKGEEKGKKEGQKEGKREGKKEGKVLAYYEMNFSVKEIAEKVHLTEHEVKIIIEQSEKE